MMEMDFLSLAEESLATFTEISNTTQDQLSRQPAESRDSFATGNTLNGSSAFEKLSTIQQSRREELLKLMTEPAIVRLVVEDDEDKQKVIYIARKGNVSLPSKKVFASYLSPIGKLADFPPGEQVTVTIDSNKKRYYVIEKTNYLPNKDESGWDSIRTICRHYDKKSYTLDSLRKLLINKDTDNGDELDRLLEEANNFNVISEGVSHQIHTAIGLRNQPTLDQFQGEIFRLPLDSQLIILGPPGTGKTTTLIKRLGQKLDLDYLDMDERKVADTASKLRPHSSSWLMFTPSELLKHYLKEAFSKEQVPASDSHIRTWVSFRNDIARNTLSVLRSSNGGRFTLKTDLTSVSDSVSEDARAWFEAFRFFHEQQLRNQLIDGKSIVEAASSEDEHLSKLLGETISDINKPLVTIYRALDNIEGLIKQALEDSKNISDKLIIRERNLLFNKDKLIFERLGRYLDSLQQEGDLDGEEAFDEDESNGVTPQKQSTIHVAVKAYIAAIKALSRTKYLKRSLSKTSKFNAVIQFLGQALPANDVLLEIGRHISFQNGLRRFIGSHKRYITEITTSYQNFRKDKLIADKFYAMEQNPKEQLSNIELDAIILLILKNTRELMSQPYIIRSFDEPKFNYLVNIAELFRNQIMVDEATDFSMLELACMANLTSMQTLSFFACGDFNQRITSTGIRQQEQLSWILPSIVIKPVQVVYRQSRKLNAFAESLLRLQGGDLRTLGKIPDESSHDGVNPVLIEFADQENSVRWIAERIKEVERSVGELPTIAVLVNSELEVKPMADKLSHYLASINLSAVACEKGNALGEGTDVRVFDIQHIKGLEFEAVFFAGVDKLAIDNPSLFDRFLYVGATRAATYLGMVCNGELPEKLQTLRASFDTSW